MSSQDKVMRKAIYNHFCKDLKKNNPRIEKFMAFAHMDLYYGPINGCDRCGADTNSECRCEHKYVGFESALDELQDWAQDNLKEAWYDADCDYVCDSKPPETEACGECAGKGCEYCDNEGYFDIDNGAVYYFDLKNVKCMVFGKELAEYI